MIWHSKSLPSRREQASTSVQNPFFGIYRAHTENQRASIGKRARRKAIYLDAIEDPVKFLAVRRDICSRR